MFEILLGIAVCVAMAKIAAADDQSVTTWTLVTFFICAASLIIPLPFIRMLIAGAIAFVAMIVWKVAKSP